MAEPVDLEEKRTAEQRLALLALTGAQPAPSGSCLDAEELSALVEGRLTPAQIEPCLAHLAGCEHCYATWRLLDEDWQLRTRNTDRNRLRQMLGRPRFLATAGTLLAAAASIAVFLNITMQADRGTLLRPPAPPSQEQVQTAPTSEAANQAQPQKKESPAPAPSPASLAPNAMEQQAAAPVAQPAAPSKKKARPDRIEPGEQEAAKPTQPSVPAPKREVQAIPAPAATAPAGAESERATDDKMREEKERTVPSLGRASDSAPATPQADMQSAAKAATSLAVPIAGTTPLTLAAWHTRIHEGCQGQPDAAFFDEISKQGQQLLKQSASLQKPERRQIERIIALLADRQSMDRQCQALREILGPVASSNTP